MTKGVDLFFKNVLIGNPGVGKTSLVCRITENKFEEKYLATIGVDFKSKTISHQGQTIKLDIWDTAGQEKFRSLCSTHYKGAECIMCVFDLSEPNSFEDLLSDWLDEISIYCNNKQTVLLVLGNKSEISVMKREKNLQALEEWKNRSLVNLDKKQQITGEQFGFLYREVSAKTGEGIEESLQAAIAFLVNRRSKKIRANKEKDFGQS